MVKKSQNLFNVVCERPLLVKGEKSENDKLALGFFSFSVDLSFEKEIFMYFYEGTHNFNPISSK